MNVKRVVNLQFVAMTWMIFWKTFIRYRERALLVPELPDK